MPDIGNPFDIRRLAALAGANASVEALRVDQIAGGLCDAPRPPARPIPAVTLVAGIDVLIVLSTLGAVVVVGNLDRMPSGLNEFLAIRVTLKNVVLVASLMVGALLTFYLVGLYDATRLRRWGQEAWRVLAGSLAVTAVATIVPLTSRSGAVGIPALLIFGACTAGGLLLVRGARARWACGATQRRRAIIVGTGPQGLRIFRELCADFLTPYQIVGFVDSVEPPLSPFLRRQTLGRLEQLEELLVGDQIDEVHIGLPVKSHYRQIEETIRTCERLGVKAMYSADIFDTRIARPSVAATSSAPAVHLHMAPDGAPVAVKRLFDVAGASAALVLAGPVMLAAALVIKLTSDGPAIYAQERCGLNRRRFRMYKFRTMVQDAEQQQAALESKNEASGPVFKIADDPRLTPVGRFLRKTSIDELPQLFNVLRGDMSLVGPRPLPLRDVGRFSRPGDLRRFSMRPGVTCLWQINGRSALPFDDWIALDLRYIDRWSLLLDMLILVRTVPAVLRGTGAR
jgi:exopolysaccharide biosynthesis polyprenyl glycosylphosphotransferase